MNTTFLCCHYGINAMAHTATHFDSLEKAAKISHRMIDIAALAGRISEPFSILTAQIKDLVLAIESTRFFGITHQLAFPDEKGCYFFQENTKVKCAERVFLSAHTALKLLVGADRVNLIKLGIIASYSIGYVSIFRYFLEGTILSYYFFGNWDARGKVSATQERLSMAIGKIEKWKDRQQTSMAGTERTHLKLKKWEAIKYNLNVDQTNAWIKIAVTLSKMVLISSAVALAVLNITSAPSLLYLLTLGTVSDVIGLAGIFYAEYHPYRRIAVTSQ